MADSNGSIPDFTHQLGSFKLNDHEFHRRKVSPRVWAETLREAARQENTEMKKKEGSVLFAVSGDGLAALVRLCVRDDEQAIFDQMYADGLVEFGELSALRDWLWEAMTERPFTSGPSSFDGPGNSTEVSSKDESSSPVEAPTG